MRETLLIVLDSLNYKKIEKKLLEKLMTQNYWIEFYYSDYENFIIKKIHALKVFGNLISHVSYWILSFLHAVRLFTVKSAESIIFINPIVGYFYCFLRNVFFLKEKNITICGFLFEDKENKIYYWLRRVFVLFCLKRISNIVVYSKIEIEKYSLIFPDLAYKYKFVEYGRAFELLREREFINSTEYFSSGGGSNRNYELLDKAISIIEDQEQMMNMPCIVATRPNCYLKSQYATNMFVRHDIRVNQFNDFLKSSKFVVIPLKESNVSAGHMVLLEAMSLGKLILISNVSGVKDYVTKNEVIFFDNTPICLAKQLMNVLKGVDSEKYLAISQNAKNKYDNDFGFASFLNRCVIVSSNNMI